jgi:hypothetical protein
MATNLGSAIEMCHARTLSAFPCVAMLGCKGPLPGSLRWSRPRSSIASRPKNVNQVIADLQILDQGEVYRLVAPFMLAPLVDKVSSLAISHWVTQDDDQEFVIYYCKE